MRWDALFEDLEAQLGAEQRRDRDAEVADRTRGERAAVRLLDRLARSRGEEIELQVLPGERLVGLVSDLGADWVLLSSTVAPRPASSTAASGAHVLVRLGAVLAVDGLATRSADVTLARRMGIGQALRAISRDRATVVVTDVTGGRTVGTIDGVGADFIDVAEHARDEARRAAAVRRRRAVPIETLASIRPG